MMIFVMPMLLYPVLGAVFFQLSQFVRENTSTVQVLQCGEETDELPDFAKFEQEINQSQLYRFEFSRANPEEAESQARNIVSQKQSDAVLVLPPGFSERLETVQDAAGESPEISVQLFYSTAFEKSVLAKGRLENALHKWSISLGKDRLKQQGFDVNLLQPLHTEATDIAEHSQYRGASFWSKLLPIMLLLWALTGAFYPAVDLCAGEKERGTLETLLCSPATGAEIVIGKLLTIMCFSILTSILNVLCIGVTSYMIVSHFSIDAGLPWLAILGMLVALLPTSLIFSALSIALASNAKSSKEGQYYLLPLIMVVMPLILVAIAPGSELTLGTALLPVSGISLSLRQLIEGDFALVLRYSPVVIAVTVLCCFFSLRFAVRQFNREAVLFSNSQKVDLARLVRSMFEKTSDYPSFTLALFFACFLLMLRYFSTFLFTKQETFTDFFVSTSANLVFFVALPAVIFALLFTKTPGSTLGLAISDRALNLRNMMLGVLAALLFYPANLVVHDLVLRLYPMHESLHPLLEQLQGVMSSAPVPLAILCIAVFPGICEELAFRGFLFGGLLPRKRTEKGEEVDFAEKGRIFDAIVLSAFFFGVTHGILQQSITAALIGCVLAVIALRCGAIWPCMAYHITHNAGSVLLVRYFSEEKLQQTLTTPLVLLGLVFGVCVIASMQAPKERVFAKQDLPQSHDATQ